MPSELWNNERVMGIILTQKHQYSARNEWTLRPRFSFNVMKSQEMPPLINPSLVSFWVTFLNKTIKNVNIYL